MTKFTTSSLAAWALVDLMFQNFLKSLQKSLEKTPKNTHDRKVFSFVVLLERKEYKWLHKQAVSNLFSLNPGVGI